MTNNLEKVVYLSFAQNSGYYKIDYAVLAQNVSAVMIRGGQGIWLDDQFQKHYDGCVKAGIPFGIWWFCQPNMKAEPQVEAFLNLWNSLTVKPMVIAYDVEEIDYIDDNGQYKKLFPPSRQFSHDNTLAWCKKVKAATGGKVGIYTRKNYFETWTFETDEWYDFWMWIAAWYNYTGQVAPVLPWKWPTYKLHQYEGGGLGTPGVDPINTCKEYFNGTHQECLDFFGGKETIAMGTYKTDVKTVDRGRFVWISSDDKDVDIAGVCTGTHAIFMRMTSQATGNMTVKADSAFPIWADRSTNPVVGVIEMDQNLFWNKEIDLNKFTARSMWTNETLRSILDQWHIAKITQAEWDAKKLNITAGDGWHKIGGLCLFMSTTINPAHGSKIGGAWQQAIVDDLLKPLTSLMQGGFIPTVPISIMASWDWYRQYATDDGWKPAARIANKQLAGVGLTRVWGQSATDLLVEVPMGTPYATLTEAFANVPSDIYSYPISLEDIDFQFFVFSFNRLRAVNMFYPGKEVTPVTCGMWCDKPENMGLGTVIPPIEPPVEPPVEPVDFTAILTRLDTIDANAEANRRIIMQELLSLRAVVDGMIARVTPWLDWADDIFKK